MLPRFPYTVACAMACFLAILATGLPAAAQSPGAAFSVDSFQHDLFTGTASAQIPIVVPAGAAGTAPKVSIRYSSGTIEELKSWEQGSEVGLGWALDVGGFVLRDMKGTAHPGDDEFRLVFGGTAHRLVLVDAAQNLYRTKDEAFFRIQFVPGATEYWIVTTKDGTKHRFGFNIDSRARTLREDNVTPLIYKYMLDEVTTTSGTSVRYAWYKAPATLWNGSPYDQFVYPDTITYAYRTGTAVGALREVRFFRAPRSDWNGTSSGSAYVYLVGRDRIDRIEITVGGALVRKYTLGYDYSIDRDPTYTWPGGATGDLTLRSITLSGTDGSPLPAVTFAYQNARLITVTNGTGGSVAYQYERVTPYVPVYQRHLTEQYVEGNLICGDLGPSLSPGGACGAGAIVGHVLPASAPNTVALYARPMTEYWDAENSAMVCQDRGASTGPSQNCPSTLLGYMATTAQLGTSPLTSSQIVWVVQEGGGYCAEWGVGELTGCPTHGTIGHVWPYIDRHRVTSRTVSDGRGGSVTTTYQYTGIASTADGKEFRGHSHVRVLDALGHYTDTWFHQDDDRKGRPDQTQQHHANGTLFSGATFTYTITNPFPGVTFVALSQTETSIFDDNGGNGRTTRQTFEYDGSGNPTRVYHWGDTGSSGDERDEITEWRIDATAWIHRSVRSTVKNAAGAIVRERWTSYDNLSWGTLGTRGLPTREEHRYVGGLGTAGNPAVTWGYDVYGNRTTTTDPRNCTTTTVYDTSETYPISVSTCLNHTTTFVHDARWGVKTSVTDPNNQTTTYTYDVFGRPTMVRGPLDGSSLYGTVSTFYDQLGDPNLQRVRTYRTLRHGQAAYHWTESYFDGLGRVYKTRTQGVGSNVILTETRWDSRGLVAAKSTPRHEGTAAQETLYTYDPRGRQIQVRHPDNTTASTAYLPDRVTLTDERGHVKRRFSDAHGRLVKVEEVNGAQTYTTTYQYDATGALTQVQNHAGQLTTLTYDLLGRKTQSHDPNMGLWTYGYDLTGNLTRQTDARNQTLTFTYDLQGRMLTKSYPGGAQVTWTYDDVAVAFSKGRVTRIADPNVVTTFQYDALGRVTSTSRLLDGTTYTMGQTWGALGQVLTQTFPDGEVVTYGYNSATWLSGIASTTGNYIDTITYNNARGQRYRVTHSNGVVTTHTYHATTYRETNRSAVGPGGGVTHQDLTYGYDNVGNITSITDATGTGTATRTFTYDALNRLTNASGTFGPPSGGVPTAVNETYTYDASGNLLTRAGVVYTYSDPAHPSAVTSTTNGWTFTYDANGNMLTGAGRASSWDADNRLTATTVQGGNTAQFAYDHSGARVRRITTAGATRYPFPTYEIGPTGTVTRYIKLGDAIYAAKKGSQRLFYHPDHLGGVHVITNLSGAREQLTEYTPWGMVSRNEGTGEPTRRFTGKELDDPEVGLLYYGGRYYWAGLGRFMSADPFVPAPGNPQSLNRYSYVLNSPVNLIDPSGYFFEDIGKFFKTYGGAIAGTIAGAVVTVASFGNVALGAAVGMFVGSTVQGGLDGGWKGAGLGALRGAGYAVGSMFGGVLGATVAAGLTSGLAAELSGGSFGSGFWQGAIAGAITSVTAAVASQVSWSFGDGAASVFAEEIANDATRGFVSGTAIGLASGRNFGDAAEMGLATAAFTAGGTQFNNVIGHSAGLLACGCKPTFRDGAFFYPVNSGGAITLGNAILGSSRFLNSPAYQGAMQTSYTNRTHELGHVAQSRAMGFLYYPAHGLALTISGAASLIFGRPADTSPWHIYNPLERTLHPHPAY